MKRAFEDGLSLLAGAGIGMALMYLMDPDSGQRRRARMARAASDALEHGGEYLGAATAGIGSTASNFADRARDRFSDASDSVADTAASVRKRFSRTPAHWWDRAAGYGKSLFNRASNTTSDWADDA